MHKKYTATLFYPLVFLSGFSGLVYEVVWQKYLGILLGAQARATAIILAIFLGGISFGYFQFGKWTREKKWNLFEAYATIELCLGLWALLFPTLFKITMPAVAALYGIIGVNTIVTDFAVSIFLIGVPTFLMGGTLPLLTESRKADGKELSRTHAKIYGYNTIGAFLGCVATGYALVPNLGLDLSVYFAGAINTLVGTAFYYFYARPFKATEEKPQMASAMKGKITLDTRLLIATAFLSGFTLITLETILIRLMGLSTGSSNYNFTLIIGIFVCCLAVGSLTAKSINHATPAHLVSNQLFASVFLFCLFVSGDYWSYWVHCVRVMFREIPQSFFLYQGALALTFFTLLAIPIGIAGRTLPLCFHLATSHTNSAGFRVGLIYGWNTVGCVLGSLLGGYLFFYQWDLDQLFKMTLFLSLIGGCLALALHRINNKKWLLPATLAPVSIAIGVATFLWPRYHTERWIQPFRQQQPFEASFKGADTFGKALSRSTDLLYWKDGPNTSVGIGKSMNQDKERSRSIFVNGKSDGNTTGDYFTTSVLAHLPGLLSPKIEKVCVIGFGTGITIGILGQYPFVKSLDVAEISSFSIDSAHQFDTYNYSASKNPKVRFHEMDAFRYIAGTKDSFDVIVSEPSNPWVAGIENLYSLEFYDLASRKLDPNGMFVQWIHTYSFNDNLLKLVLNTMKQKFSVVSVFQMRGGDLALVGRNTPFSRETMKTTFSRSKDPKVAELLAESGIRKPETLLALEVMPAALVDSLVEGAPIHRLENPKLSDEAARAFYAGTWSHVETLRRESKGYYSSFDSSLMSVFLGGALPDKALAHEIKNIFCDRNMSQVGYLCSDSLALIKFLDPIFSVQQYREAPDATTSRGLAAFTEQPPKKASAYEVGKLFEMFDAYKKVASPISRIPAAILLTRIDACLKSSGRTSEIFGHCLLQKVVVLDSLRGQKPEWITAANEYLEWFPTADSHLTTYSKFKEAYEIIKTMSALQKKVGG